MKDKSGEKIKIDPRVSLLVEGIVLAAGYSSRTGTFKMGLPVQDKPVIKHVIDAMASVCQTIYIVTGHWKDETEALLSNYTKEVFKDRIYFVENKHYQNGMFSSVKRGVSALKGNTFFLTPGDYPFLTEDIFKLMLKVSGSIIIPRCRGRKGHPVLFKDFDRQLILDEPDSSNLKACIQKQHPVYFETDSDAVLIDLDTREDYNRILERSVKEEI